MIDIVIYGLDQFIVGNISKDITSNVAKIYEVSEDEINFIAPNTMVFHKGVEQTSWNVLIHVYAPKKVSVLEDQANEVIMQSIINANVGIHIAVEFYYYSVDNRHVHINDNYPRYITEDNAVSMDDEYPEDIEEGEEEDQIYTGDIFKDCKKH